MYDRSIFLKLNNYGYSDEDLEEVKNYLTNRELPDKINTNVKAKRYDEKWGQFEIRDDKLFSYNSFIFSFLSLFGTTSKFNFL